MAEPKKASSGPGGRTYSINGKKYPSVTTILNAIGKSALTTWAANQAAQRAVKYETVWHAIQQEEGDDAAQKWIALAPNQERDMAALRGSAVHDLIEHYPNYDEGLLRWYMEKLVAIVPNHDAHLAFINNAYDRFVEWASERNLEILEREFTVYSGKGYAGTADMLAVIDGKTYLVDVKTSKGVYPTAALQLAAYRYADFIDGDEPRDMPEVDGTMVLHVRPEFCKAMECEAGEDTYELFLSVAKIARYQNRRDIFKERNDAV